MIPVSVNSLSGGKTSSYMAIKYPADVNVFACVLTRDPACRIRDKGLLKAIQDKLPQFEGSRELDQTLINLLKLEQEIGKEIKWVASELTYEDAIAAKKYLPNKFNRFCTFQLKLYPIFWFCYLNYGLVIQQIGFRADEYRRVESLMSNCDKAYQTKASVSCTLSSSHRMSYREIEWRLPCFPLVENGVTHSDVIRFWSKKGWEFPTISNCDFCFFHRPQELSEQRDKFPDRYQWWEQTEKSFQFSFGDRFLSEITSTRQLSIFEEPEKTSCSCTD